MSDLPVDVRSRKLTTVLSVSIIMAILTVTMVQLREFPLDSTQSSALTCFLAAHVLICLAIALDWWPSFLGGWRTSIYWFGFFIWTIFWAIGFSQGAFQGLLLLSVLLNVVVSLVVFDHIYQEFTFAETPRASRAAYVVVLVGLVAAVGSLFDITWGAFGRSTLTGVGLGSIYALATIGFVIVYNTTDVLNFAQGALVLAGGYVMILFVDFGLSAQVAVLGLVFASVLFGLFLERFTFRYLIGASKLSIIVVTLALIQIIPGILTIMLGGQSYRGYPASIRLGDVTLPMDFSLQASFVLAIILAVCILTVLVWFFRRTVVGPALRSAGSHQSAAAVLGISIKQTIKLAWVISIMLAMISGVLLGIAEGGVHFGIDHVIILIFAASIFGGLDSLVGAFVGSLTVGLLELYGSLYFVDTFGDGFGPILPMLFLIVILMIKPSGLWGTERIEKL